MMEDPKQKRKTKTFQNNPPKEEGGGKQKHGVERRNTQTQEQMVPGNACTNT